MYYKYLCHLLIFFCFNIPNCTPLSGSNVCKANGRHKCCYNHHQVGDRCEECPLGSHGHSCALNCSKGFYGKQCREECTCDADECDIAVGCIDTNTESRSFPINTSISKSHVNAATSGVNNRHLTGGIRSLYDSSAYNGEDKNNSVSTALVVAIVSSIIACLIINLIILFIVRKKFKKLKMDHNDRKTKRNRVSNAVMSKIYDEIGDSLTDNKTKKSSSIKSIKNKSKGTKEEPGASKTVDGESALAGLSRGSYALLAEPKQTEITETDCACLAGSQNSKKYSKTKSETGHCEAKDGKKVVLCREKSRNQQQEIRVTSDYDTPPPLPTARDKEVTFQESDYQIPPKRMDVTISSEETQQHQTGAEDEKNDDRTKSPDSKDTVGIENDNVN